MGGGLRLCGCSCSRLLTRQRQYKRELEDTTKYGDSAEYSAAAIHLERFGLHYLLVHEGELSRIRGRRKGASKERGHLPTRRARSLFTETRKRAASLGASRGSRTRSACTSAISGTPGES